MSRTSAEEVSTQAVSPVSIFGAAAPSCAQAAAAIPSQKKRLRSSTLLFLGIFVALSKVKNPRVESPPVVLLWSHCPRCTEREGEGGDRSETAGEALAVVAVVEVVSAHAEASVCAEPL